VPQFAVHRNRNAAGKARFPLLLDVQSDLLEELATRVVVPLTPATAAAKRVAMHTLTPICTVDGKSCLMLTTQMAGISARELGPPIGALSHERSTILAALDLLFTGI
jgi:toxin CcdB